jgi:hypothetical protein
MLMDVFTNIVLVYGAKGELDVALEKCDVQLEKVGDASARQGNHPQPQRWLVSGPEENRCGRKGL